MGEELHEILQNSSNEEHIEDKDREGSNFETDKEADENEESALQREENGRTNRKSPLLHVQPIRLFLSKSQRERRYKGICCYEKESL
jgi:hypothetical protein